MFPIVTALMLLAVEPAAVPAPVAAPPTGEEGSPAAPAAEEPSVPAEAAPPVLSDLPAAEPAAAPAEPQVAAPAPSPSETPADSRAPRRFTASLGLGRAWPGGDVRDGVPMNDLTGPMGQMELWLGYRIRPRWLVGLFFDVAGGGDPGAPIRNDCALNGDTCATFSGIGAIEGRYVFTPAANRTWWAGVGLGGETTGTAAKDRNDRRDYLETYTGGVFRLSGGWDRRVSRTWGWGFQASLSTGAFDKVAMGSSNPGDLAGKKAGHSWLGLAARIILFP